MTAARKRRIGKQKWKTDHIRDNFDIFDFELTDEDMEKIAGIDKNVRYYTATPEMIAAYAAMELKEDL